MKPSRKTSFVLSLALILFFAQLGYSQDGEVAKYPNRPINFIVPNPAGGPSDLVMRLLGKEAEKYLGQPVVVVNKPGAALALGVATIASAKADGYTIGFAPHSALFVVPHFEKVPYHPLKDLRYIVGISAITMGIVVKDDSPFKSFKDLIAFARQNPKKVTYGDAGTNSLQNIITEQIGKKEKVVFTHIPYKGTAEWQTALLGGHLFMGVGQFTYSMLEAKQIRLLLLLKEERSTEYPQAPVLKDLGYDIPCPMIFNVVAPKGIPDGIAKKLEEAYSKAIKEPAFAKRMKEDFREPIAYRNSKELTDYVTHSYEVWEKYLIEMGVTK
jgi:tripartite-type tricarboxylate transporter receptor subunit TctC